MRISFIRNNSIKQIQALVKHEQNIVTEDKHIIHVKAGSGGAGMARYNGIGGNGGSVILKAKPNMAFVDIRKSLGGSMKIKALSGQSSQKTKLIGSHGESTIFSVPVGVEVVEKNTNILLARCTKPFYEYTIARGGRGGCADNNFKGEKGDEFDMEVHLKLKPNVGLVGFPNAGKSTLLKAFVPRKSVKIAPYPFTTVKPQMAFWTEKDSSSPSSDDFTLSIADLPGIIEEYCDIILLVVDCNGFQLSGDLSEPFRNPVESVALLLKEMEAYDNKLLSKPTVLLLNKIDIIADKKEPLRMKDMLSSPNWENAVSPDLRPQNPIKFDYILPISAKSEKISEVKTVLKRIYKNINPYETADEKALPQKKLL
ncbi:unnamed protein product [Auanema sp. JU1783]|nr:unnamed protein product [Auanema sp. JU1783]